MTEFGMTDVPHKTSERDLHEAIRLGIWRGAQVYAEGLFRVYVSPSGDDDQMLAKGLAHLRDAYLKANMIAAAAETGE
jgi:hypothetical protein